MESVHWKFDMRKLPSYKSGFTLIELLVVISIILILITIALPNFTDALTRAKVARARADMRTVSVGLEQYFIDWQMYPPDHWPDSSGYHTAFAGLFQITTPLTYLLEVPEDIFSLAGSGLEVGDARWFMLASTGVPPLYLELTVPIMDTYVIFSRGPDGSLEFLKPLLWPYDGEMANPCDPIDGIGYLEYSPTNGTDSGGDLNTPGGELRSGLYCVDRSKVISGKRPVHR
jgi:prepilin-type N-terminal cleavage/methylation domain-containing protein